MSASKTTSDDQHDNPVARYPTTRELVAAALADPATYTNHEPTPARPNCVLACEDVDGNPRQLIVIALGGRMALADRDDPHLTTVWTYKAADQLRGIIDDAFYPTVHGGDMTIGNIPIAAFTDIGIHADSTLSIEVSPYTKTVGFRIESGQVILTWQGDQEMLTAIADMCVAAGHVLRGDVSLQTAH